MDHIIMFEKNYLQRLNEYLDVLSSQEILPASQVKKEWSYYLEVRLEPTGWQAVWKIPRIICQKHKIPYPTIVLVYIVRIDSANLTADVKILAVQDDLEITECHTVNLINLWPTKHQDESICLDMVTTANALDMLRFFYGNIWRPWDLDDSRIVNWLTEHLEIRLRLYFDMKMGVIPRNVSEKIRSLLIEARGLETKLNALEDDCTSEDSETEDESTTNDRIAKLRIRTMQIKLEIEIMEIPQLRNYTIQELTKRKQQEREHWLVFDSGRTTRNYIDYLLSLFSDEEQFQTATSLQNALNSAAPGDSIVLIPGKHKIESMGALEQGGTLKGLPNKSTVIETQNEDIMMDLFSEQIQLENLTIDGGSVECPITIRYGSVHLKNCDIIGCNKSSTQQGILILAENELILDKCRISGFSTGIYASAKSKLILNNCVFEDVGIALKVFDNNSIVLNECKFKNCNEYAIFMETNKKQKQRKQIGNVELLETIPNVKATNCIFESNHFGDVVIYQKADLIPVRDLFADPAFNTTMQEQSENLDLDE